jgi:hypothetical protein
LIDARFFTGEQIGLVRSDKQTLLRRYLYTFDPVREDMPICLIQTSFDPQGEVRSELSWEYLDYAKTPDGQWYPSRWRKRLTEQEGGRMVERWSMEWRLRLFAEGPIDAAWFKPPVGESDE